MYLNKIGGNDLFKQCLLGIFQLFSANTTKSILLRLLQNGEMK